MEKTMNSKSLSVLLLIFWLINFLNGVSSLLSMRSYEGAYITEAYYPQSEIYQERDTHEWNFSLGLVVHNVNCSENVSGQVKDDSANLVQRFVATGEYPKYDKSQTGVKPYHYKLHNNLFDLGLLRQAAYWHTQKRNDMPDIMRELVKRIFENNLVVNISSFNKGKFLE